MTTQIAPTARRARKASTFVALSAAALLAASCGTGEDSPAADGPATTTPPVPAADSTQETENSGDDTYATADLVDVEGQARGTVEFAQGQGGTLVSVEATDLPPGFHGFHIHGIGECEPDSENPTSPGERGAFLSAGGHLSGPDGDAGHSQHAGDLPPLYVTQDGSGQITTLTDRLNRDMLLDEDGSAVMIHENSDNLANIPERYAPEGPDEDTRSAGDGGSRIACGPVTGSE